MTTTGSLVRGTVDGMDQGLCGSGEPVPRMTEVVGNPSGILTGQMTHGSDLAYDSENHNFYMHLSGPDQENWVRLVSGT